MMPQDSLEEQLRADIVAIKAARAAIQEAWGLLPQAVRVFPGTAIEDPINQLRVKIEPLLTSLLEVEKRYGDVDAFRRQAGKEAREEVRQQADRRLAKQSWLVGILSFLLGVAAWYFPRAPESPPVPECSVVEPATPEGSNVDRAETTVPPEATAETKAPVEVVRDEPRDDHVCVVDGSAGVHQKPHDKRAVELCRHVSDATELECVARTLDYGRIGQGFAVGIPTHFVANGRDDVLARVRSAIAGSTIGRSQFFSEPSTTQKHNWRHQALLEELCGDSLTIVIGSDFKEAPLGLR